MEMKRFVFGLCILFSFGEVTILPAQGDAGTHPAEELVPYRKKHKWGFADTAGVLRTKAKYDTVDFFRAGLAIAGRPGKLGLIDSSGSWIVPRRYAAIRFDPRYRRYWLQDRKTKAWLVRLGEGPLRPATELGQDIAELDRWVSRTVPATAPHRGYRLERTGNTFTLNGPGASPTPLPGTYDTLLIARPFRLYFRSDDGWGIMSYRSEELFPAQFEALEPPLPPFAIHRDDSDVYAARREGRWGLVSWDRGTLLPFRYTAVERIPHLAHQLFRLTEGDRQGFYDLTTGKLVAPRYRQVGPFDARGLARVVTLRGRAGYVNWNGTEYFTD